MAPSRTLFELQQLEQAILQNNSVIVQLTKKMDDTAAVQTARNMKQDFANKLADVQGTRKDIELEISSLQNKLDGVSTKLYSGTASNPKELLNLQQDSESLKKRKSEKEDLLLEQMLQDEELQAHVLTSETQLEMAEQNQGKQQSHLINERDHLGQANAKLQTDLESLYQELNGKELTEYNRLKTSRGTPVSKVERGICSGCGLTVPSSEAQRAKSVSTLVYCGSCGRILFAD